MSIETKINENNEKYTQSLAELEKILQKDENRALYRYIGIISDFKSIQIPDDKRDELIENINNAIKNSSDFAQLNFYIQKLYNLNEQFKAELETSKKTTSESLTQQAKVVEASVQRNTEVIDTSGNNSLIDKLKSDDNLKIYKSIFESYDDKLKSQELNQEQKNQIIDLLKEIYKNKTDHKKIGDLFQKINQIIKWEEAEDQNKSEVQKNSESEKKGGDPWPSFFFKWNNKGDVSPMISKIDFDWSYSPDDIRKKINDLKTAFIYWEIWKEFSREEKETIIRNLEQKLEDLDEQEEISLAKLEVVFDQLARSIEKRWDKYYLKIEDTDWKSYEKEFDSEDQALEAIKKLKSQTEGLMQSVMRSALEWFATWFAELLWVAVSWVWYVAHNTYWILWEVYLKILNHTKDTYKNAITAARFDDYSLDFVDYFDLVSSSIISLVLWSLFIWVHLWALESLKRRVYNDFIRARDQKSKDYVLEDYDLKRDPTWNFELPTGDAADYKEYIQRQNLMEAIKTKLDNMDPWSPEYKKFAKKVAKLEKYKLNKTSTFYYLAYKYVVYKDDHIWNFANSIMNTFHRWARYPVLPQLPWTEKKDSEWIIVRDSEWKAKKSFRSPFIFMPVKDDHQSLYTKTVEKLTEEKGDIIKWLQIFYPDAKIDKDWKITDKDRKSAEYEQILNYIESSFSDSDQKTKMKDRFEAYVSNLLITPKNEKRINTDLYILLEKGYLPEYEASKIIKERINAIKSEFKLFSPKKLSRLRFFRLWWWELSKLQDLMNLVKTRQLLCSKEELDKIIDWFKKWGGFASANYTNVINANDVDNFMKNVYGTWKKVQEIITNINNIVWNNLDEFNKSEFWKWVNWYVKYILPNKEERTAKIDLNNFLKLYYENKSTFQTEDEFYKKVAEVVWYKGGKTSDQEMPAEGSDNKTEDKNSESFDKDTFIKEMEWKATLENVDFKEQEFKGLKWPIKDLLMDRYKVEINKGLLYQKLLELTVEEWETTDKPKISDEIEKFANSLRQNWYTKWQAWYILREIISWSSFEYANTKMEETEGIKHEVLWEIWDESNVKELKEAFQNIENDKGKVKEILDFIVQKEIDKNTLPNNIKIKIEEQELIEKKRLNRINEINEEIKGIDKKINKINAYIKSNSNDSEIKRGFITKGHVQQIISDLEKRWIEKAKDVTLALEIKDSNSIIYNNLIDLAYAKIDELNQKKFNSLLQLNSEWVTLEEFQRKFMLDYVRSNIITRLNLQNRLWISKYNLKVLRKIVNLDYLKKFDSYEKLINHIEKDILIKEEGLISKLLPLNELLKHEELKEINSEQRIKIYEDFSFHKFKVWDLFKKIKP